MYEVDNAAKFLNQLYIQTNFQCTRQKLQKLIIFADLIYIVKYGESMFRDDVITATIRGLSIDALSVGPYTLVINSINKNSEITDDDYDENKECILGYIYGKVDMLSEDKNAKEIECIVTIFKTFGAYDSTTLTNMSKATKLWKDARNDNPNAESVPLTLKKKVEYINTLVGDENNTNERVNMVLEGLRELQ